MNSKPMLNAYPDSLGGNLGDIVTLLKTEALQNVFSSFYILPSLYHSDLDRGFSVIDYDLNEQLANRKDLEQLKDVGIDLKLDFILNHASAQSPQFRDLVEKGEDSAYRNFFIDWNHFWEGHGTMTEEGYIQPDESCLKQMFFRKPGLPILMVEFPDGKKVPYWNTFYQEVHGRQYLGQMDVNIQSPKVWEFYRETLEKIASYGAAIVKKKISTVNMLGCHDGIPLLDLKGLLPEEEIQSLIDRIVSRGGMVKNLHGQKNLYYQVNATYYSALGESDEKMLLARAIQMFMPGKPQVWYLDLFAGKNDHEAVRRAGESGHKEINRTNLSTDQIAEDLKKDVVQKQLALIRMRNTHKAFSEGAEVAISGGESSLQIRWEYNSAFATLNVNFESGTYTIVESR